MPQDALVVNKKDNVATALNRLEKGGSVRVEVENKVLEILLLNSIPFGHKFALEDIDRGESITKYGEKIGIASLKISRGDHVHLHNVEGFRGRGDKNEV